MIRISIDHSALARARAGIDYFQRRQMAAIKRGGDEGIRYIQSLAQTRYISSAGGRPNPPPGPLKRRSGRLAKAIRRIGPTIEGDRMIVGLDLSGAAARYGYTHEYGGRRAYTIRPVRKKVLRFIARDGTEVFAREVRHPPLAARPFLYPAGREGSPFMARRIDHHLDALAREMLARYLR